MLAFYTLINVVILIKNKQEIIASASKKIKILLFEEALFLLGLFGWSFVRAHQPDVRGLEKFMDFGFINSILRGEFLPPGDMWAADNSINYYWFGHLITAVLTRISGIPEGITYNLMLGTILGVGLTSAFSISASLILNALGSEKIRAAVVGGLLSALLMNLGGNFHTPYYVAKNGFQKYWYPDATRFIGYNPDTNDKTIHEFPSYSFIVSDLHGHLLDFPVVLVFLSFLAGLTVFSKKKREKTLLTGGLGFLVGVMFMTNTWDFGIYLLVSGVVVTISNFIKHKLSWRFIYATAKTLLIILIVGLSIAIPFILNFSSIAQGVDFVKANSPLWQLAILWGFPAILTLFFVSNFLKKRKINDSVIFVFSLIICGWILIFLPEVIFVKDIYIGSHHRANTMFKLTYQGFILFYLTSGFIFVYTLLSIKRFLLKFIGILTLSILITSILIYPYFGLKSYYGELKTYRGLNGEAWLEIQNPGEYQAILWFRKNVAGKPTILEAAGDSYTDFNVISAYTGLPTISGWFVHEWLWRGTPEFPQKRANDVNQIYMTQDSKEAKNLLSKYNVTYVVVGTFERQKYPQLSEDKFTQIGSIVFSQEGTRVYQINYNWSL